MPDCLLYYITDRRAFDGDEPSRRHQLLQKISEAARANVDYIQLREKDLPTRDLESLAREATNIITRLKTENRELRTILLINSRTDIALSIGVSGVHLRSDDITPADVKKIWQAYECGVGAPARTFSPPKPLISVSCHLPEQVRQAAANQADLAIFAPVFEKKDAPGTTSTGLAQLREACKANIPVLALGGITLENAVSCLEAGAAGIAAIRLFQGNNVSEIVRRLRQ